MIRRFVLLLFLALPLAAADELTQRLERLAAGWYKPNAPGAAVLVLKNGKPLLRKGYGLADLELGVPITPDMVFRIGSLTKQFTSTAILQLVQQGKIGLGDDITKYLPDYPTKGKKITVEQLLTHTSGIKNYNGLPTFVGQMRNDRTPEQLIDTFKDLPPDFEPGEKWAYSNSGYILLGAILEKVAGMKYEEYVRRNLFAPLGMTHTRYDREGDVIPKRAKGYGKTRDGWVNAPYISMTQPFAAGALVSTVDDLAKWNRAMKAGTIVDPALLKRAWTPAITRDAKPTHYGYGWRISAFEGHRTIEHGGGIFGFLCYAIWLPDDDVYVVVLTNSAGSEPDPRYTATQLAATVIGKAWNPRAIALKADALERFVGTYRASSDETVIVSRYDNHLFMSRQGRRTEIKPMSSSEFFADYSFARIRFDAGTMTIVDGDEIFKGKKVE